MENKEFEVLVSMLTVLTSSNKITWEPDESGGFNARIGKSSVGVTQYYEQNTEVNYYSLIEYNSYGKNIENFTFNDTDGEDQNGYKALSTLYTLINDKVYQISETKSDILTSLQKMMNNKDENK